MAAPLLIPLITKGIAAAKANPALTARVAGAALGAGQLFAGKKKMKQAGEMVAPETDPARVLAMEDALRKERQLSSGTDTTTQTALQEVQQTTAATQRGLSEITGGNVGGTVSAMLSAQRMGDQAKNRVFADASSKGMQMGRLADAINQEISQRKMEIQNFKSSQRRAEGAQLQKQGFGNLSAGIFQSLNLEKKEPTQANQTAQMPTMSTPPIQQTGLTPSGVMNQSLNVAQGSAPIMDIPNGLGS